MLIFPQYPPPTCSIWFHLGLLHTILDRRLGSFESSYEAPYLNSCLPSAYWVFTVVKLTINAIAAIALLILSQQSNAIPSAPILSSDTDGIQL